MKKLLLSTVALVGLSAGAMAADLPARRAVPYVAPVPVFTWTGFYVGVNAGAGWTLRDDKNCDGYYYGGCGYYGSSYYGNHDDNNVGFVGGGQIGYNYQMGAFVVGVEADIQYADLGGKKNNNYYGGYYGEGYGYGYGYGYNSNRSNIDWFGTVRARLGFAWDRALLYATGGFAYGGGDNNNHGCSGYGYSSSYYYGGSCDDDDIRGGYVVGGGLEYAFTPNLTAKIEGLYVNLDSKKNNNYYGGGYSCGGGGGGETAAAYCGSYGYGYGYSDKKRDNDFAVVRVGLNYKF